MSDATTGQIRWRYSARRRRRTPPSNGSKGLLVSATAGPSPRTSRTPDTVHRAGIDLPTYAVLDAVSGKVLTEVHTDGTALAVDADHLLVAEDSYVVAHGVSSPTHWRAQLHCTVTQGELMGDQAVVVDACGGNGAVVRGLDLKNGDQRWEVDLGNQFDLSAELDPATWVGDLVAVPDTREVSGLHLDRRGRVERSTSGPSTSARATSSGRRQCRAHHGHDSGPSSCDAQLAATHASLVLITCRSTTDPDSPRRTTSSAVEPGGRHSAVAPPAGGAAEAAAA